MRKAWGMWRWALVLVMLHSFAMGSAGAGQARRTESAAHKAAREAVAAAIKSLAKLHNQISELRGALDESVPFQIEECERISQEEPEYQTQDWEILEKDAKTNHDFQTLRLMMELRNDLERNIAALLRLSYRPAFSRDERNSLNMAISLLRKAKSGYVNGLTDNAEALSDVSKHNCAEAIEVRSKSSPHFYEGDSYLDAAVTALEWVAAPEKK